MRTGLQRKPPTRANQLQNAPKLKCSSVFTLAKEKIMPPVIDREKCVGCGVCADVCPLQVFSHHPKTDKVPEVKRPYECWHCNACVLDCKAKAIELRLPLTHMLLYVDADTLKPAEQPTR